MSRPPLPPLLLVLAALAASDARAADPVTIYRCVGRDGTVTLSDAKCPPGQRQEVREMLRPQDPPPVPASPAAPASPARPAAPPAPAQVVIYRTPPRPMYLCTSDDGRSYTSDNGDGNPRMVPLWSLGYPGGGWGPPGHHRPGGPVVVGNTWVRDACHQLPQAEVCDRLRDRRYEIQRQYHSALQSERHALDIEQRGLDARLDNDCGAG